MQTTLTLDAALKGLAGQLRKGIPGMVERGLAQMRLLDPQIGWRGPWNQASQAAEALLARRVPGKVVPPPRS
jgi:hypothetical protein